MTSWISESADALDRAVDAVDGDEIPHRDGLEQQQRHSAHEIAQCALHGKADGDTGGGHQGDHAGQGDAHHVDSREDHDHIQDDPDDVAQEALEGRLDPDLVDAPPEELLEAVDQDDADDQHHQAPEQLDARGLQQRAYILKIHVCPPFFRSCRRLPAQLMHHLLK